jgi:hypothetical protein
MTDTLDQPEEDDADSAENHGHVGDIEDGPIGQLQEIHHVPAGEAGRPEQSVDQVPADPGCHETEADRPSAMAQPGHHRDHQEGQDRHGQQGEDPGRALPDREGRPRISDEIEPQHIAEDGHRLTRTQPGHRCDLGEDVQGENDDGDRREHFPRGPSGNHGVGHRRSWRCLQDRHIVARG